MYSQSECSSLRNLIEQTSKNQDLYKPLIFNPSLKEEKEKLLTLAKNTPGIQIFDTIKTQVKELVKCLKPTLGLAPLEELERAIAKHFGEIAPEDYGVWVFYPWNNKLVHLLNEEEFVIVRTNRNKHKITEAEQAILATKKIGVMGLSVGQSVSVTLAMERGFGELRIADFDELDLSNINRIRTGVFNISVKKTVIVAREIAEIDPYLKVTCFDNGITAENIASFLTENGNLDLLIDECDSFDVKINARKLAKELQIPVLMEGSDRGTIDIERFDLEPERPVLHGMIDHLDMSKFKDLKTFDDKIPYITAVTGVETLSPRMKASAIELMATISTWPQLASAVTYGGGVSADLSRKILLNSLKVSGRFFLDLDEMITNETLVTPTANTSAIRPSLTINELQQFIENNKTEIAQIPNNHQLTTEEITYLINAAKQAPSGGNNQPWKFHYQDNKLHLFLDESTAHAYLDPDLISSYLSIGAAIENLLLAAASKNLHVNWSLTTNLFPTHIAVFSFDKNYNPTSDELLLEKQIFERHTNRKIGNKEALTASVIKSLTATLEQSGSAKLTFVDGEDNLRALAEIATETDLLRMFIPEAHEDFITKEMRWSVDDTIQTQDGIGIHTLDLGNNDQIGIRILKDKRVVEFLQEIEGGSVMNRLLVQQFTTSSAMGIITIPNYTPSAILSSGMAIEKMWLAATALGHQIHPINVPLLFFYKNSIQNKLPLTQEKHKNLVHREQELKQIFSITEIPIFMFRIFKATTSPEKTIRKSNDKFFSIGSK